MSGAIAGALPAEDLPGQGLFPWLVSLLRDLRALLAVPEVSKQERELALQIEFAASHLGDGLLQSEDIDDFEDRMDALLETHEIFLWNALVTRLAVGLLRDRAPSGSAAFMTTAEPMIGPSASKDLSDARPLLDAWLRAQHRLLARLSSEDVEAASAVVEEVGPRFLVRPEVPPEVATALAGALRAGLCSLAIARAIAQDQRLDEWLARALVAALLRGVYAHLRFLASVPEAEVPEALVPLEERLDLDEIRERHRRARVVAERTYQEAVARLRGDA